MKSTSVTSPSEQELGDGIWLIRNFCDAAACEALIRHAEGKGFEAASITASAATFAASAPVALFQARIRIGANARPRYAVSRDGRFLILPRKLVGFAQTSFSLEESDRPGTNSSQHYYRDYLERWSLLGRPRPSK